MKKVLFIFLIFLIFTCKTSFNTLDTNCQKVETEIRPETKGSATDSVSDDTSKVLRDAIENGEKHTFQAEINQLLGIIVRKINLKKDQFIVHRQRNIFKRINLKCIRRFG
jgi:hypothetical protein